MQLSYSAACESLNGRLVYAIADIHGEAKLLETLHNQIRCHAEASNAAGFVVVYLGDYVDFGHNSRDVIDRIVNDGLFEFQNYYLVGDHDLRFLNLIESDEETLLGYEQADGALLKWLFEEGGSKTLASYGVYPPIHSRPLAGLPDFISQAKRSIPSEHATFLRSLMPYIQVGDFFFSHAGARPGVPLTGQSLVDLTEIRRGFLDSEPMFEKIVVHGHTPNFVPVVKPNRIGVDLGGYASGRLCAAVIGGSELEFLVTG